jgi:hypothetical protein
MVQMCPVGAGGTVHSSGCLQIKKTLLFISIVKFTKVLDQTHDFFYQAGVQTSLGDMI